MTKSGKTKKARKITDTDKAFYRLGYLHGEQKLHETIMLLHKTNRNLWDELLRLDRVAPVVGVVLTFTEAERLVRALEKPKSAPSRARTLREKIKSARTNAALRYV